MLIVVFLLVSLGALIGLSYLLGAQARYFEPKYELVAEFTEVGGLTQGATVRLAGVQIGRVTRVMLPEGPGAKVRVSLSIARRFGDRIRGNSVARIETQGLLGDKIVEISLGSPRGRFRFDPKTHNVIQPFIYVREVREVFGGLSNVPIDKIADVR